MKLRSSLLLAVSSAGLASCLVALPATTARRPRYGGTLRVEVGATVSSLDPAVAAANTGEDAVKGELDSLIYGVRDADGTFRGAGPFHVTGFEAGKRAVLEATEDYRLGRPFVDSIEITMARAGGERVSVAGWGAAVGRVGQQTGQGQGAEAVGTAQQHLPARQRGGEVVTAVHGAILRRPLGRGLETTSHGGRSTG